MPNITPVHLIIILVVALLILGPGKLPEVGAALGKSIREFRKAATDMQEGFTSSVAQPAQPQQPQTYPAAPVAPAPAAPTAVVETPPAPAAPSDQPVPPTPELK